MVVFMLSKGHVARVLQGVAVVMAGSFFLYQVSLQVARYLTHPTTTSVNLILPPALHMPPVLVCPQQPFNPKILKEMGLDIEDVSDDSLPENIISLRGLNTSIKAQQVWEDAGFILGNLIHNFTFGNISENYTASSNSSSYWRKVITPLGSCLALLLPPFTFQSNELPAIIINVKKVPLTSSCLLSHECSPEQMKNECNSNCEFERLLNDERLYYYFLLGRFYPHDGRDIVIELEEHLNFLLAEDFWQIGSLDSTNSPLNVVEVDTTAVDRRPLRCDQDSNEFSGPEFSSCINTYIHETKGCVPVYPDMNLTLQTSCRVPVIQDIVAEGRLGGTICRGEMLRKCHKKQWVHEIKYGLNMNTYSSLFFQFTLSFTSPKIHKEVEEEMYPISQLASDMGGSLGLNLGISIMTLAWFMGAKPQQMLPESGKESKWNRSHFQNICYWSVVSCLSFCTLLHSAISLQIYLTQVPRTTVIRATTVNNPPADATSDTNNLHDIVAARLASRALDCQPEPQPPGQQCVLDCLMTRALKQVSIVAPFMDVEDLPVCPAEHGWKFSPKYVVPSLAFTTTTDPHLVKQCTRWCEDQGLNITSGLFTIIGVAINHEYYHITVTEFLCSLGGIVGLYAGLFLSNAVPAIVSFLPDTSHTSKHIRRVVKIIMELFIHVSGIAMTIVLLHRYIFDHPISSQNSGRSLTTTDQPVITTCFWPPFKHIISQYNLSVPLDDIWAEEAWEERISRVTIGQSLGKITNNENDFTTTFIMTPYNRCQRTTAQAMYNNLMLSFYYWHSFENLVLISLHGPLDQPFSSQMYETHMFKVLTLDVLPGRYTRLTQHMPDHTPSYTTCLYTCVHDAYSDRLGCRLPFVTWRQDLSFCSLHDARQYPTWPKMNEPPPVSLSTDSVHLKCHTSCRHLKTEYYVIQGKESKWVESGVNVVQRRSSFVDIEEVDLYPFSHLFNNLGVVAGFTFGTSILSLMFSAIRRLLPYPQLSISSKPTVTTESKVVSIGSTS